MENLDYMIEEEMGFGSMVPSSFESLRLSENQENMMELQLLMKNKSALSLTMGLDERVPFYAFESYGFTKRMYVNPELENYILQYLLSGIIPSSCPKTFFDKYKVEEDYILIHLKRERNRGVTTYKPVTLENKPYSEFKAKYPFGTIHYGFMPFTKEQMVNKLENLK